MTKRTIAATIAAVIYAFVFGGAWLFGENFIDTAGDFTLATSLTQRDMAASILRLDKLVDQGVTLTASLLFGLFIIIGFAVRSESNQNRQYDVVDGIAGVAFIAFAFVAFFFAYSVRAQAINLLSEPVETVAGLKAVRDALAANVGQQAFWTGLAALPGIFLVIRSIVAKVPTATTPGGAFPVTITISDQGKVEVTPDSAIH